MPLTDGLIMMNYLFVGLVNGLAGFLSVFGVIIELMH